MNSVVSAGKYMPPVLLHSGGARWSGAAHPPAPGLEVVLSSSIWGPRRADPARAARWGWHGGGGAEGRPPITNLEIYADLSSRIEIFFQSIRWKCLFLMYYHWGSHKKNTLWVDKSKTPGIYSKSKRATPHPSTENDK